MFSPDAPALFHYNVLLYSTAATRSWGGPVLCGANDPAIPCHVYLTSAEDMSSTMFVNAHTALDESLTLAVRYCPIPGGSWPSPGGSFVCPDGTVSGHTEMQRFDMDQGENERIVHTALVQGLAPNTDYAFVLEATPMPFDPTVRWFRTMGVDGSTPATVALGGDTGVNEWGTAINAHVAANNADFAVVSGDVAYTNGIAACYNMWDTWSALTLLPFPLTKWTENRTKMMKMDLKWTQRLLWSRLDMWERVTVGLGGRMIPLLISLGNHDVGSNALSGAWPTLSDGDDDGWRRGTINAMTYFPHHRTAAEVNPQAIRRCL